MSGLLAAGDAVPPPSFTDAERQQKLARAFPELEQIAQRWLESRGAPGVAWGVVVDGELVRFGSTGFARLESRQPITADTVFRIASMTKSFTALAILMLRDEGKLDLDAAAARYVPELAASPAPTRDAGPITVRQLLTHTAGYPEDNPWGDRQLAISDDELSRWLAAGIPFSSAPGSAFEYSNYGFAILGRIVQNVSRMPYEKFMNERVLVPLGMRSSWWDPGQVPRSRLAAGYRKDGARSTAEVPLGHGAFGAMGGLLTSSNDLARWVRLMLAAFPPRDEAEAAPALRRSVREMQQGAGFPVVSTRRSAPGAPLEASASVYAFGLRTARSCDLGTRVGHSGGLPGFGSYMEWLPEYGVGLFAMANLTYAAPTAMVRDMLAALARSGGLAPRQATPSPALVDAGQRLAALVSDWSDAGATRLAASNLFLDETLQQRRDTITAFRRDLGTCRARTISAANALRGSFRMDCDSGWLDVTFTLAPTQPPTVQFLDVQRGRPLSPTMRHSVAALVEAMWQGPTALELAREDDRAAIGALLAASRESHGSCRAGEPQEGDGDTDARVRLHCDRGPLDLRIQRLGRKISLVQLGPPPGSACTL